MNLERLMIEMNKANKKSWKRVLIEMNNKSTEYTEKLCRVLIKNKKENVRQPSKVVKPANILPSHASK